MLLSRINRVVYRHHKQDGLTLIELLIVIALVGIVAAIAIPVLLNVLSGASSSANAESAAAVEKFVSDWTEAGYSTAYIAPSDSSLGVKYEGKTIAYTDSNGDGSPELGEPIIAEISGSAAAPSAPSFTNGSSVPGGEVGVAYSGFTFAASGSPSPTFSASGLPAGLHLDSVTGTVSGTPSAPFEGAVVITASNASGSTTVSPVFDIVVGSGGGGPSATLPQFGQAVVLPDGQVGQAYDAGAITVSGSPTPVFTASGLPAGLSIDSATGDVSGTPTAAVNGASWIITITNTAGTSSVMGSMNVADAYTIPTFDAAISLPDGQVGVAYYATLPAFSGTPTPTVSASGLPAGLSVSSSGVVSGTPTTAVNDASVTFTLSNVAGASNASATMSVADAYTVPEFTSAISLPDGQAGVGYSATLANRSGTPTPTYSSSDLPAGLSISSSGHISGTPSTPGTYTVDFTLSNVAGSATASGSLYVAPAYTVPQFTSALSFGDGRAGAAYSAGAIGVTGNPAPTFSASGLPAGVSINSGSGALSGTPTTAGNYTVTVTLTNIAGSTTASGSLYVAPAYTVPQFTSALSFPDGRAAASYSSGAISVTGNPAPTFSASGLPAGLTMSSSDGSISGAPTTAGSVTVTVTLTNVAGSISASGSLNVTPAYTAPQFTSAISVPDAQAGSAYTATISNVSGNPAPTFSSSDLPSGLSIDSASGVISGTPTTASNGVVFHITLTNVVGSITAAGSINIAPAYTIPTFTSSPTIADGQAGSVYSYTISTPVSGNPAPAFSSTDMPAGLSMNSAGHISGTPTTSTTYTVHVTLTNIAGSTTYAISFNIAPAYVAPQFTAAASFASGQVGVAYSNPAITTTGNPAATYSASGLPAGLVINTSTGAITGTPSGTPGTASVSVTATNVAGSITESGSIVIAAAYSIPSFNTAFSPGSGTTGVAYSYTDGATGNPSPTYSATGLPSGLSIDPGTGAITGTPSAAGTSSVSVTATNAAGSATVMGSIVINAPAVAPVWTVVPSTDNGFVNQAVSFQYTASGSPAPVYAASGLPSGLSISATTGLITGTATASFSGSVTVSATNSAGLASRTVTVNIQGGTISTLSSTAFTGSAVPVDLGYCGGQMYVSTYYGIWLMNSSTGARTLLAGSATSGGSSDGTGSAARFGLPAYLTFDSSCDVFDYDEQNYTVRETTPSGVVTTITGYAGSQGNIEGTKTATRLNLNGLVMGNDGNLYGSEGGTYGQVIKIIPSTGVTSVFVGGTDSTSPVNGTGTAASFHQMSGIGVDTSTGNFFVLDQNSSQFRMITPAGVVTGASNTDFTHPAKEFKIDSTTGTIWFEQSASPTAVYHMSESAISAGTSTLLYAYTGTVAASGLGLDGNGDVYVINPSTSPYTINKFN